MKLFLSEGLFMTNYVACVALAGSTIGGICFMNNANANDDFVYRLYDTYYGAATLNNSLRNREITQERAAAIVMRASPVIPVTLLFLASGIEIDARVIRYWTSEIGSGYDIEELAHHVFNRSPLNKPTTDAEFIGDLYRSVLERAPDAAGAGYWLNELSRGVSRPALLLAFAQSEEFISRAKNVAETIAAYSGFSVVLPSADEIVDQSTSPVEWVFEALINAPDYAGPLLPCVIPDFGPVRQECEGFAP